MTDHDIRQAVTATADTPIHFLPGDAAPTLLGRDGGYFTRDGRRIAKPQAYKAAGGRCEYVAGTLRVEVGVGWLVTQVSGQANT